MGKYEIGSFVGLPTHAKNSADDDEDARKPAGDDEVADDDEDAKAPETGRKSGKKAKRRPPEDDESDDDESDDDDDDDNEDDDESGPDAGKKAIRKAERARCAAILSHPEAQGREQLAFHLACGTGFNKTRAIDMLKNAPKGGGNALHERMDGLRNVNAGRDSSLRPGSQQAMSSSWDAAGKKAGVLR